MTTGLLITTAGQAAIAADLAGGADLVLSHVAFGDAGGVPYAPNAAQVALVNERYRATIASVAVVAGAIVVDAIIPADTPDSSARPSHGFNIAEAGIYSAAGTLIGVARMGSGYKPPPSSGQAAIATFRFKLAVANPSAITVVIDPLAQISVGRQVRPFFLTVEGLLNAPPGVPAAGATYAIGAAPTGAWAGFANRLAQWVGVWALATVPLGHQVVDNSVGVDAGGRWLELTGAGWVPSLGRLIQKQPGNYAVAGGSANAITVTLDPAPANLAAIEGTPIRVKLTATNTDDDVTINFGTGVIDVRKPGGSKPAVGDLAQGMIATFVPDGTVAQLISVGAATGFIPGSRGFAQYTTPGTYNWVCPDGVFGVLSEIIGGGGAGGGSSGSDVAASGGGAGGYSRKYCAVTPGVTYTVVVGAGGTSNGGNADGNAGATSSFGPFHSATGGGGGVAGGTGGGSSGNGIGGDVNRNGGGGFTKPVGWIGGDGGGVLGTGGIGTKTAGGQGSTVGSGGAGGYGNFQGGPGAAGAVYLSW